MISDPENGQEWPDRIATALAAYDETLRAGAAAETGPQYVSALSPSMEPDDFRELQSCLRLLEEVWPRSAGRSSTSQGDRTGSPEQSTGNHRLPSTDRQQIGRFAIDRVLGSGGFGVVYLALDPVLKRQVALKIPQPHILASPELLERFRREARIAASLDHPHIVPVYETGADGPVEYLVSAYCPGMNLADWLRAQQGPVAPRLAAQLIRALADAVDYSHARGVLHRDLKPSNVLIVPQELSEQTAGRRAEDDLPFVPRITDFGLAKVVEQGGVETKHSTVLGTPSYMAPEQAFFRAAEVGPHTDVHALGAILYELVAGRPPFAGETALEVLEQVRSHEPISPRQLRPAIPHDLETICLKCLEKEPGRRFATAHKLADELARFLRGEPIHSRPIGGIDRTLRWCRRRPAVASLITVSALAVVVIITGLLAYSQDVTRLNIDLAAAATTAKEMQALAEEGERQAKDRLYAADINLAAAAWRDEDTRGMMEFLDRHVPQSGEPDRRGFEWWYLRRQATLAHRVLLDVGSPQYILVYSPDRQVLASAGRDAVVRLFDPETGRVSREITTGQIEVNGAAFSPNGNELATAGDDGTIRIWNLATGSERLNIKAHVGKAFQVLFTSDGDRIISCGDNPIIRVFNAQTGHELQRLEGHQKDVQSLVLADGGKTLVSTSNDRTATIWDLEEGKASFSYASTTNVGPVIFLEDRRMLIIGNDAGLLQTIDISNNREIARVKHLDRMGALARHPNGVLVAAGDAGGRIRLRTIGAAGDFVADRYQPWQAHRGNVYSLVWSGDGSRLISAGDDGRVVSWSLAAALAAGPRSFSIEASNPMCLIPKSDWLITSAPPYASLMRWDWKTGTPFGLSTGNNMLHYPAASPNGRLLTVISLDPTDVADTLHLLEVPNEATRPLDERHLATWRPQGKLRSVRFSPDSRSIAVSRLYRRAAGEPDNGDGDPYDHAVWLLSLPNLDRAERIPVPYAKNAVFAPGGRRLAVATRAGLVLWDIIEQKIVWEVSQTDIDQLTFGPGGKFIATGGVNRLVVLRNASDGTVRFRLARHLAPISSMAFSPDGHTLVAGANDGAVKLWHVATGQELLEFQNPGSVVRHVQFAHDGRHLLCHCGFRSGDAARADPILIFDVSEPHDAH